MVFDNENVFDLDTTLAELEEEFADGEQVEEEETPVDEEETTEEETTEEETQVAEEEITEEQVDDNTETDTDVELSTAEVNDPDVHKRNEAFKQMRLENEKLAQRAKFIEELASSYGLTAEELINKFEEDKAKKEAEASGMSVDQWKRMQELEKTVQQLEQNRREERFNLYADKFVKDNNLTTKEFQEFGRKATELGFNLLENPQQLDVVYKALNYEKVAEQERQKILAEQKRRRESSTGNPRGGRSVDTTVEDMDAEIDSFLKEQGIGN